ncbi:hypothetical protein V8F33_011718 [Rhypophila sp. PSN 637]
MTGLVSNRHPAYSPLPSHEPICCDLLVTPVLRIKLSCKEVELHDQLGAGLVARRRRDRVDLEVFERAEESPGKATQEQARPISSLLERLWKKASHDHQRAYIQELRGSAKSIGVSSAVSAGTVSQVDPSPTAQTPKELANKIAAAIDKALTGGSVAREFCLAAGMYPRLSPMFALGRLARAHWGSLSREWQRCLVNYALSLVYLQRAKRLASFIGNPNRKRELQRELANLGSHNKFDPLNPGGPSPRA